MQALIKNCNKFDVAFLLVVLIAIVVIWAGNLNQTLFFLLNSWHVVIATNILEVVNFLARPKGMILPIVMLLISLFCKKECWKNVIYLIISYYVIFHLLKIVSHEARPFVVLAKGSFFFLNDPYENLVKNMYHSFPSGHTGAIAILVFALIRMFFRENLLISLLLSCLVFFVAFVRIASGWHWPLDVLFSMLIANILVQICFYKNKCIS